MLIQQTKLHRSSLVVSKKSLKSLVDAADMSGPNLVFFKDKRGLHISNICLSSKAGNDNRLFIDLRWFTSVFAVLKLAMFHHLTITFDLRRAQLA